MSFNWNYACCLASSQKEYPFVGILIDSKLLHNFYTDKDSIKIVLSHYKNTEQFKHVYKQFYINGHWNIYTRKKLKFNFTNITFYCDIYDIKKDTFHILETIIDFYSYFQINIPTILLEYLNDYIYIDKQFWNVDIYSHISNEYNSFKWAIENNFDYSNMNHVFTFIMKLVIYKNEELLNKFIENSKTDKMLIIDIIENIKTQYIQIQKDEVM